MQTERTDESIARRPAPFYPGPAGQAPPHVLVVDDDKELLKLISRVFDRIRDVRVSCHSSPIEALKAFLMDPHGFSLVLTDYRMPEMSGEELAEQMRLVRKDLPIVAVTGSTYEFKRDDVFVRVIEPENGS